MSFWTIVLAVIAADTIKTIVLCLIEWAFESTGWRPE